MVLCWFAFYPDVQYSNCNDDVTHCFFSFTSFEENIKES
jgi:hypothetical protein